MNKILYIATSDVHLALFHQPWIKWLHDNGVIVDIVAENRGGYELEGVTNIYYLDFPRNLHNLKLFTTYSKLKRIINKDNYDVIHCHTPIPSMLTRLASREARRKGAKVLYTAHGFHFYKGAPFHRWLIYYPVEYVLSTFTDAIITMNKEDYNVINKKMLHKDSYIVPGMGVDGNKFKPASASLKKDLRHALGISEDKVVLLYIAEFIPRKNHQFIVESIKKNIKSIPNIIVLFAGKGPLLNKLKKQAKEEGLSSIFKFLGFRKDVPQLVQVSDIGISASRHEGLPIGILQEMFSGLPIVASLERGHSELVSHGENGFLFKQNNEKEFIHYVQKLYDNPLLRKDAGKRSLETATRFNLENALDATIEIYKKYVPI